MELRVKEPIIGDALKEIRKQRHLSQSEAAYAVGVSMRTWQLWEAAEQVEPHPKHRRALIAWLNGDASEATA